MHVLLCRNLPTNYYQFKGFLAELQDTNKGMCSLKKAPGIAKPMLASHHRIIPSFLKSIE